MVLAVISLIQHCLPNLLLLSLQPFTSKLTSPLAGALHFQTYFSSRCSTSLPNLLLLSLQHVTSKLTGCSSRCSTSLPNLLLGSSCFSTALPNLPSPLTSALHIQTYFYIARCSTSLLPNLLQICVRSSLLLRRCTALHSTLPPPLTSTLSHTHTHSMHALVQRQDKTILSNGCEWREPVQMYTQIACLLTQSLSHTGSTSLPHLLLLSLRHSATHTHIACTLSFNDRTRLQG